MATTKQLAFIAALKDERAINPEVRMRLEKRIADGTLDVPTASQTDIHLRRVRSGKLIADPPMTERRHAPPPIRDTATRRSDLIFLVVGLICVNLALFSIFQLIERMIR